MKQFRHLRKPLETERDALKASISDLAGDPDATGLLNTLKETLGDLTNALSKLEAGTFGGCERCKRPVGHDRLEAMPAARYCLNCAEAVDAEQQGSELGAGPEADTDEHEAHTELEHSYVDEADASENENLDAGESDGQLDGAEPGGQMSVWLDQDLCTGCGLCVEAAPAVFALVDGVAHVKAGKKVYATKFGNPQGPEGLAAVPKDLEESVIAAADECPGETIFIEIS